jgi:hypothetical protein
MKSTLHNLPGILQKLPRRTCLAKNFGEGKEVDFCRFDGSRSSPWNVGCSWIAPKKGFFGKEGL